MNTLVKGTHHVALKCSGTEQFAAAVRYYCDTLGMTVIRQWGEGDDAGIMLDTGDSILEIFAAGLTVGSTGSINHYALATDDVDACLAASEKAGCRIKMPATDIVIPSPVPYPARVGFVVGPVGEEIEFFCEM